MPGSWAARVTTSSWEKTPASLPVWSRTGRAATRPVTSLATASRTLLVGLATCSPWNVPTPASSILWLSKWKKARLGTYLWQGKGECIEYRYKYV